VAADIDNHIVAERRLPLAHDVHDGVESRFVAGPGHQQFRQTKLMIADGINERRFIAISVKNANQRRLPS
jgi:hypothetical protein